MCFHLSCDWNGHLKGHSIIVGHNCNGNNPKARLHTGRTIVSLWGHSQIYTVTVPCRKQLSSVHHWIECVPLMCFLVQPCPSFVYILGDERRRCCLSWHHLLHRMCLVFVADEPEMRRKTIGCCWGGTTKKHPAGDDVYRFIFISNSRKRRRAQCGCNLHLYYLFIHQTSPSPGPPSQSSLSPSLPLCLWESSLPHTSIPYSPTPSIIFPWGIKSLQD